MTKKEFTKLIDKHLIISQRQNVPFGKLHNYISGIDKLHEAMNFTRCCTGETEQFICLKCKDKGWYKKTQNKL